MENIKGGQSTELVALKARRDTYTNRYIKELLVNADHLDPLNFLESIPFSLEGNSYSSSSFIEVSPRAQIHFAKLGFDSLNYQELEELSGVIHKRLTTLKVFKNRLKFSFIENERMSLYMLQDAIAEKRALLLGEEPPLAIKKPQVALSQFAITTSDISKVLTDEEESIALIYRDLDDMSYEELKKAKQVVDSKKKAVHEQSMLESNVGYEEDLTRLGGPRSSNCKEDKEGKGDKGGIR